MRTANEALSAPLKLLKTRNGAVSIFFLLLLLTGVFIVKDYGLYWDEQIHQRRGIGFLNYVLRGERQLMANPIQRSYGALPDILLAAVERGFKLRRDTRLLYLVRHFVNFLIFSLSVFFFFLLGEKIFRSWRMGLLGSLFLVLSPRIFAQAFYNAKDIPLMSAIVIAFYTLVRFVENPTFPRLAWHALACAVATDVRAAGLLSVFLTGVAFLFLLWEKRKSWREIFRVLRRAFIFGLLFSLILFAIWPTLWENPVGRFLEAFRLSAKIPYLGRVFYWGKIVEVIHLPWHYVPVWISISVPLLYLIFGIIGTFALLSRLFRKASPSRMERIAGPLILLWFFFPLLSSILLNTYVYDEWRHLFFIYPALILLCLVGVSVTSLAFPKKRFRMFPDRAKTLLVIVVLISLFPVGLFMVRYHPHQYVYFNLLAGRDMASAARKFETDYWGLSYKQGLEYLLKLNPSGQIKVLSNNLPGRLNTLILPRNDRRRIIQIKSQTSMAVEETEKLREFLYRHAGKYSYNFFHAKLWLRGRMTLLEKAELENIISTPRNRKRLERMFVDSQKNETDVYFLTNFRLHTGEFPMKKIHSIKVGNAAILGIYWFK